MTKRTDSLMNLSVPQGATQAPRIVLYYGLFISEEGNFPSDDNRPVSYSHHEHPVQT